MPNRDGTGSQEKECQRVKKMGCGRPKEERKISCTPSVFLYKPQGIPLKQLEQVEIFIDEWEAIRLFNKEKLNQEEGAKKMGISQSTFQRILCSAREKLALSILDRKAIKIQKSF